MTTPYSANAKVAPRAEEEVSENKVEQFSGTCIVTRPLPLPLPPNSAPKQQNYKAIAALICCSYLHIISFESFLAVSFGSNS